MALHLNVGPIAVGTALSESVVTLTRVTFSEASTARTPASVAAVSSSVGGPSTKTVPQNVYTRRVTEK